MRRLITNLGQPGVALGQQVLAAEGEVLLDDVLEGGGRPVAGRRIVYVG